jgi:hypothetical protein
VVIADGGNAGNEAVTKTRPTRSNDGAKGLCHRTERLLPGSPTKWRSVAGNFLTDLVMQAVELSDPSQPETFIFLLDPRK